MNTNELKQKIEGLLNECPERSMCAKNAAAYHLCNPYSMRGYSVQAYHYTQVDFYNLVAKGNAENIAAFIESEVENLRNSFLRKIENVNDCHIIEKIL